MRYFLTILKILFVFIVVAETIFIVGSIFTMGDGDYSILIAYIAGWLWTIAMGVGILRFLAKNIYDIQSESGRIIILALGGRFDISSEEVKSLIFKRNRGWLQITIRYNGTLRTLFYQPRFSSQKYVTPGLEEIQSVFHQTIIMKK